jgi:hypothetical protein
MLRELRRNNIMTSLKGCHTWEIMDRDIHVYMCVCVCVCVCVCIKGRQKHRKHHKSSQ